MAMRLATFATVPVKRFWRAVNPVSKGDPLCAAATAGTSRMRVTKDRVLGKRRGNFQRKILRRAGDVSVILIGTSDGYVPAVMCHTLSPLFSRVQDFLSIAL
jgi:hypothetical protein